jgi:hypothetical protein
VKKGASKDPILMKIRTQNQTFKGKKGPIQKVRLRLKEISN